MPLFFWIAWAWIKSIWSVTLLPLLAKIPWQVWAGLAVVIAFMWYGHVREKRGNDKCWAQVELERAAEVKRQEGVSNDALAAAENEKREAQQNATELKERLDATLKEVDKLKEANQVCLPKSITDQYRRVRKPGTRK